MENKERTEKDKEKTPNRTTLILAVQGYITDPAIRAEDLSNEKLLEIYKQIIK